MGSAYKIILISFLMCSQVKALELNWKQAVEMAQQNSLELQSAIQTYKSVEELETGALSGFMPQVSASASGTQSGPPSGPIANSYSAQISVSQNLFAGFSDLNNYYLKKNNSEQALAVLNTAKAQLSADLKQAYVQVYYLQDYKKLVADILKRREDNYNNVKLQYNVGRENRGSLMLSEAYVDSAKYDRVSTDHNFEIAQENLRRLLGVSATEQITITDKIAREELASKMPDFDSLAEKNPDVISSRADEMAALYNLRITRSEYLPSLDLSGSYGYTDTKFFPSNDRWSVGLTLSIPIFNGLKTYSSSSSNAAKYEGSKSGLLSVIQKTVRDLKTAYYAYIDALAQEKINQSFSQAAILRAEVTRAQYKNGFISFVDWDNVENDLIAKEKANLDSEKNRVVKQSLWEQAQGIGVF